MQLYWGRHSALNIYWISRYLIATPFKNFFQSWRIITNSLISHEIWANMLHNKKQLPCQCKECIFRTHPIFGSSIFLCDMEWINEFSLAIWSIVDGSSLLQHNCEYITQTFLWYCKKSTYECHYLLTAKRLIIKDQKCV